MPPLSVKRKLEARERLLNFWDGFRELQQVEGSSKTIDTHLMCLDGCVPVHGPILAAASVVFNDVFLSQGNNYFGVRTVILPDFKVGGIFLLVQFIYYGFVNINSLEDAELLKDLLSYFKVNVPSIDVAGRAEDMRTILYYRDNFDEKLDVGCSVTAMEEDNNIVESESTKGSIHSISNSYAGSEDEQECKDGNDFIVLTGQKEFSEKTAEKAGITAGKVGTAGTNTREVLIEQLKTIVNITRTQQSDSKKELVNKVPTNNLPQAASTAQPKRNVEQHISCRNSSVSLADSQKTISAFLDEVQKRKAKSDKNESGSDSSEILKPPAQKSRGRPARVNDPKRKTSECSAETGNLGTRISSGRANEGNGNNGMAGSPGLTNFSNDKLEKNKSVSETMTTIARRSSPRTRVRHSDSASSTSSRSESIDNEDGPSKKRSKITPRKTSGGAITISLKGQTPVEDMFERSMSEDIYSDPDKLFELGRKCFVCEKIYENPMLASKCVTETHEMVRCYLCFSVARTTTGLFDHYKRSHQKNARDNTVICPYPDCQQVITFRTLSTHCLAVHITKKRRTSTGLPVDDQHKTPPAAATASTAAWAKNTASPTGSGRIGSEKSIDVTSADRGGRVPTKGSPKKGELLITKDTGNGQQISYKMKY